MALCAFCQLHSEMCDVSEGAPSSLRDIPAAVRRQFGNYFTPWLAACAFDLARH